MSISVLDVKTALREYFEGNGDSLVDLARDQCQDEELAACIISYNQKLSELVELSGIVVKDCNYFRGLVQRSMKRQEQDTE